MSQSKSEIFETFVFCGSTFSSDCETTNIISKKLKSQNSIIDFNKLF